MLTFYTRFQIVRIIHQQKIPNLLVGIFVGVVDAIGTGNQRIGKEKDDC
ncbi:hypothetical protein GW765_02065 [Candidatus Parcubacteria bacterium]|nr:hypothetical protein [Candidatus Parcubacteria bacterium]